MTLVWCMSLFMDHFVKKTHVDFARTIKDRVATRRPSAQCLGVVFVPCLLATFGGSLGRVCFIQLY